MHMQEVQWYYLDFRFDHQVPCSLVLEQYRSDVTAQLQNRQRKEIWRNDSNPRNVCGAAQDYLLLAGIRCKLEMSFVWHDWSLSIPVIFLKDPKKKKVFDNSIPLHLAPSPSS